MALAEAPPAADPILTAMQQELAREKADLVIPGMQRPYFIQYRLEDIHSYDAIASYGALTRESGESSAGGAGGGADWQRRRRTRARRAAMDRWSWRRWMAIRRR